MTVTGSVWAADSVAVVLCPGGGDGIQAMKAGLLEVADLLVVNKADLEGADRLMADLSAAVGSSNWICELDALKLEEVI